MMTGFPKTPWRNVTAGLVAMTDPKSATSAPDGSVVSDTGETRCSTMRARTETRCVHGAVPAGPRTVARGQDRSSNPGESHPTGTAKPSMSSV